MCEYLDQVGATYYIRRPVPLDLQGVFRSKTGKPRVDWKESLRTKDRATAKKRLHVRVLELDQEIAEARARLLVEAPSEPGNGPPANVSCRTGTSRRSRRTRG